ncbi:MAG: 3-oxoacyl-[acyl-carrier protein] reductase [Ignavibacteriae bacterium]|nr:MAG: 3-oxoacyl-[acyl-carrier protein] reductase [Ignavibacteriota bacterium]
MKLLDGKVAIVTGAARGIGKAIAVELAQSGAKIAITDIASETELNATTEVIKALGGEALAFRANAASFSETIQTVDKIYEFYKRIDILVNNAGITKDGLLLRMTEEDWDLVINVNLKSVFNYTKAVIKYMMNQKSGKIISIASVVGLMGNAGQANYAASKAGIIGFTKSIAREVASRNIQVNAVAPGYVETPMTEKLTPEQKKALTDIIPMKRTANPEEIAKVVRFLASPESDYITGEVISVNGGLYM